MFKDFYCLLGVPPTASAEMIRKAYKRMALLSHPDRIGAGVHPGDKIEHERDEDYGWISDSSHAMKMKRRWAGPYSFSSSLSCKDDGEKWARERMRETSTFAGPYHRALCPSFTDIKEAYDVLSDVARRYLYDLTYEQALEQERQRQRLFEVEMLSRLPQPAVSSMTPEESTTLERKVMRNSPFRKPQEDGMGNGVSYMERKKKASPPSSAAGPSQSSPPPPPAPASTIHPTLNSSASAFPSRGGNTTGDAADSGGTSSLFTPQQSQPQDPLAKDEKENLPSSKIKKNHHEKNVEEKLAEDHSMPQPPPPPPSSSSAKVAMEGTSSFQSTRDKSRTRLKSIHLDIPMLNNRLPPQNVSVPLDSRPAYERKRRKRGQWGRANNTKFPSIGLATYADHSTFDPVIQKSVRKTVENFFPGLLPLGVEVTEF